MIYGNGEYIQYVYDDQDRLIEEYHKPTFGAEVLVRSYIYDAEGNLYKVIDHSSGKTYTLTYDFLGRLMYVSDESGNDYQ